MTDINVIDYLAQRFGNQTRLAKAAGVSQPTIAGRKKSNSLSHEQMRRIIRAAPAMGVAVVPEDFFPELAANDNPTHSKAAEPQERAA